MTPEDDSPFAPFFDIHADDPEVGRTIHGYRLLRLVAYGGMGKVFLAEQPDLERRVAFKLARSSLRGEARRWFASEGRIHARLEHPNIATLYDAGTLDDGEADAGRPFFAMEFVDGEPIDAYCQTHRLGVRARLEIFLRVLSAVEHAHRQPVVHLDLKPGNILVTPEGEPKLLDFGIAQLLALEPDSDGQGPDRSRSPLTLQYASPEQLRGDAVSVASDLYSLGVVLYKLLAGRLPHQLEEPVPLLELEKVLTEQEPLKPSLALSERRLAGDLDSIVLKALCKAPERRYGSVEELSDDIRRHLEGVPVLARNAGAEGGASPTLQEGEPEYPDRSGYDPSRRMS